MSLSLITSLLGYSALSLSQLDALKKIAVFSSCGILSAWVSVIALGSITKTKPTRIGNQILLTIITSINALIKPIAKHLSFKAWALCLVISGLTLYYLAPPLTSDNSQLFFNPSKELLAEEKIVSERVKGFEPGRYLIVHASDSQTIYDTYSAFNSKVAEPEITKQLFSPITLFPSPEYQQQNYQLLKQVYDIPGASATFLSELGIEEQQIQHLRQSYINKQKNIFTPDRIFSENGNLLPLWINANDNIYSFILIPKGVSTQPLEAASKHFDNVHFINTLELSKQALKQQRESASILLTLSYGLIAILLLVPITATIGTVIVLTIFSIEITLFNLMGLFILLGLGMDYVIFSQEMRDEISTTQNAILLSAMTTALSFGLLSMSSIPVAQAFGSTLLIGNTINFVATLLYIKLKEVNTLKTQE